MKPRARCECHGAQVSGLLIVVCQVRGKRKVAGRALATFKQPMAANSRRGRRNSDGDGDGDLKRALTIGYFERLGVAVCHDINFLNRPVRTRIPGGVAGEQSDRPPPMPISLAPIRIRKDVIRRTLERITCPCRPSHPCRPCRRQACRHRQTLPAATLPPSQRSSVSGRPPRPRSATRHA